MVVRIQRAELHAPALHANDKGSQRQAPMTGKVIGQQEAGAGPVLYSSVAAAAIAMCINGMVFTTAPSW
jgi:hypothetical protein